MSWQEKKTLAIRQARYLSLIERAKEAERIIERLSTHKAYFRAIATRKNTDFEHRKWDYSTLSTAKKLKYDSMDENWRKELHVLLEHVGSFSEFAKHYEQNPPRDYNVSGTGMQEDFRRMFETPLKAFEKFLKLCPEELKGDENLSENLNKMKIFHKRMTQLADLNRKYEPVKGAGY